jgi:hypothetical protein
MVDIYDIVAQLLSFFFFTLPFIEFTLLLNLCIFHYFKYKSNTVILNK